MQKKKKNLHGPFVQHFERHINFSFTVFVSACVNSPEFSRWLLCSEGCFSGESVCACVCVCMHVCVWPCIPLLSAVILPASGFDKDQHCGGKWINSCLLFVSVCMSRFASLCSHRCLFMMSVFMHYMCIFMFAFISGKILTSNQEEEETLRAWGHEFSNY